MKNKKRYLISIITICFFLHKKINCDPIITLFFQPYYDTQYITKKLSKPGKIACYRLECVAGYQTIAGIFATYGGYLQVSDTTGQIIFPLKHEEPSIPLIITTHITPITMFENTIHHWELVPGIPAHMYMIKRTFNESKKISYWQISSVPLPQYNQIPFTTLIVFAKPQHCYLPTGTFSTQEGPHLILPPLYIRKGIKITKNALYLLNIRHLLQ